MKAFCMNLTSPITKNVSNEYYKKNSETLNSTRGKKGYFRDIGCQNLKKTGIRFHIRN